MGESSPPERHLISPRSAGWLRRWPLTGWSSGVQIPHDGRATVLVLTSAGQAVLADTRDWYEHLLTRALAGWAPDEMTALHAALNRFSHDIERALGHHNSLEAAP